MDKKLPHSVVGDVPSRYATASDHVEAVYAQASSHKFTGAGQPDPKQPKPITEADLPPEAQAILGLACQDGDCLEQQPLCPPDPRITCQLIAADSSKKKWVRDWVKLPWRIQNARKGDLIMSPGGSTGVIGGLLSQLSPPQHYTHMGIMTRDRLEIRHATGSDEWLQDHPNGHIALGGPQPSDGFQPNALRYGWPGTITQSIDAAYQASLDDNYAGAAVKEAASGKSYVIHALGFEPTVVNEEPDDDQPPRWKTLYALVVKPCPVLETDAVRQALHRIADAVISIRGHYRFYSYSEGAISEDSNFYGPPTYDEFEPDPQDPCKPWHRVKRTIPVVCSTLIWAAVQRANATQPNPKLVLDSRPRLGVEEPASYVCKNDLQRHPHFGEPDKGRNGLYLYDEMQRSKAAEKLHEILTTKVRREIAKGVPKIVKQLGGVVITVGAVISLLSLPIGILVVLLGLSMADLKLLVEWTSDMPDDVANQVVNAFASDYCDTAAKDSDRWKKPGVGHSVSPDNIINCWSAPQPHAADPREELVGLYGYNKKVIIRPPKWEIRPLTAWAVSPGPGRMFGQVLFAGKPINGAVVKVCCRETHTQRIGSLQQMIRDGVYDIEVPAGNYLASAGFEDPNTGVYLSDEKEVSIQFLGNEQVTFELQPPPASDREIVITGHMDIVSRVAVGHDWWNHPAFHMPHVRLGPYGKPSTPDADMGKRGTTSTNQDLSDYGSVRVGVTLDWQSDFSINVTWEAGIYDGDDKEVSASVTNFNIAADGSHGWIVDLSTGGAWPDRAHIEFSVSNNRQP